MKPKDFLVRKEFSLKKAEPDFTCGCASKEEARRKLKKNALKMQVLQELLYADGRYGLLVILQGMDTSGKDSLTNFLMSGLNPAGCDVINFKAPSAEELTHDYLWRCAKRVPARGSICIFNCSYYEEVLVVRVHPEFLEKGNLSEEISSDKDIWLRRYSQIRNFESYLAQNGILVLKFFLYISREEQNARMLERIEDPEKNWKFSLRDLAERERWDDYMRAYEGMMIATSTPVSPWYAVPADHKWFAKLVVSGAIISRLRKLPLRYPHLNNREYQGALRELRRVIESEK